jgi:prophage antirepressor-like protein
MQNTQNNTITVNGKQIELAHSNQKWWVAVKPICEVLNVHYKAQHRAISEDKILGQLSSIQRTVGADGRQREMLCLPEKFIYGWVFSLQSESEELQNFKLECYDVLFNHFHGANAQRMQLLKEKSQTQKEIEALEDELKETETYKKIAELKKQEKQLFLQAKSIDRKMIAQQLPLWESEKEVHNG